MTTATAALLGSLLIIAFFAAVHIRKMLHNRDERLEQLRRDMRMRMIDDLTVEKQRRQGLSIETAVGILAVVLFTIAVTKC